MSKTIAVVGTGYVGLIAAVGLADFGNRVIAVDRDEAKLLKLQAGESPIYEPGVEEYLRRNIAAERLSFTNDLPQAIQQADVLFIAVGTPMDVDGRADLSQVFAVADEIASCLDHYLLVVTKSTVPVGTNRAIAERIAGASGKQQSVDFDVASNPEFLREGRAVQDFFHPDRTVIGVESERARDMMFDVYRALNLISVPFVWTNLETAELVKYASNAFLATKIAYINEMAELCEAVGADVHVVARAMGMDGRISPKFLHPGPGYGGSCFPKDTLAIIHSARAAGVELSIIAASAGSNVRQKQRVFSRLRSLFEAEHGESVDLKGMSVAVLGLAFKQETDDIRESPSLTLVSDLASHGVLISAYDPKAMDNFSLAHPDVKYCRDAYSAAYAADALVLMTEWNEFRSLDLQRLRKIMKGRIILDARNLLDRSQALEQGFLYRGVGR